MANFDQARTLLRQFKGDTYLHGLHVLPQVGSVTAQEGKRAVLVRNTFTGSEVFTQTLKASLAAAGVQLLGEVEGAAPNAPREDLFRITTALIDLQPDVLVSFGGGSTIDATKAAEVLRTLGGSIDDYFGTGLVTQALARGGKKLSPHVAIQTASSSAAHLTKYSNITDVSTGQKKLIVDNAIVPPRPVFDYSVTFDAPISLTSDGALDGISHSLEVLYSAVGKPEYATIEAVAAECIRLIVNYLPAVLNNPREPVGREALGLATDLGGYSIMLGGTNGAHLTSFSLVDLMSHGRACGLLNPYYTVFFAPAVQAPLKVVGQIYRDAGYTQADIDQLSGRDLGVAVAEAMIAFEQKIGLPTTLNEVPGFSEAYIDRALTAARNPQLKMKLENMPVKLNAETIDEYMGSVLQAAKTGDLKLIKNVT
ncbi:MAG TPA: iron-containing alcohol dehydrogenase [Anaerolineae bacterium]|nr:iron-containing alcohol dehydrogenase [Anaerolineae bacterium]